MQILQIAIVRYDIIRCVKPPVSPDLCCQDALDLIARVVVTRHRAFNLHFARYIDDQKPKDVFFFEQDGSYVLRLLMNTRQGSKHSITVDHNYVYGSHSAPAAVVLVCPG